MSGAD